MHGTHKGQCHAEALVPQYLSSIRPTGTGTRLYSTLDPSPARHYALALPAIDDRPTLRHFGCSYASVSAAQRRLDPYAKSLRFSTLNHTLSQQQWTASSTSLRTRSSSSVSTPAPALHLFCAGFGPDRLRADLWGYRSVGVGTRTSLTFTVSGQNQGQQQGFNGQQQGEGFQQQQGGFAGGNQQGGGFNPNQGSSCKSSLCTNCCPVGHHVLRSSTEQACSLPFARR